MNHGKFLHPIVSPAELPLEMPQELDIIAIEPSLTLRNSSEILAHADTIFPFTLFPDTIIVDRTKVTIVKRTFFRIAQTFSMRIEDVLNVSLSLGPFFGSIKLQTRFFHSEKVYSIDWLTRRDAILLKHIIQGYVIALHNEHNVKDIGKKELLEILEDLGHDPNR